MRRLPWHRDTSEEGKILIEYFAEYKMIMTSEEEEHVGWMDKISALLVLDVKISTLYLNRIQTT